MTSLFDREGAAIEKLRSRIWLSRRGMLKVGVATLAASPISVTLLRAQSQSCAPTIPADHSPSNGGICPYPIPWLDKNGNHNQPAAPNVELSSIYHFKGQSAIDA